MKCHNMFCITLISVLCLSNTKRTTPLPALGKGTRPRTILESQHDLA